MSMFFLFLVALSVLILLIGMVSPRLVRAKSRGKVALSSLYFFIVSVFLMIFFLPDPQHSEQDHVEVGTVAAANFTIISKSDRILNNNRKSVRVSVVAPDAKTKEQRVNLVVYIAKMVQKETGANMVRVTQEPSELVANRGSAFAIAYYMPDGCDYYGGNCGGKLWNVEAAETQVSEHELAVWVAWNANRDDFEKMYEDMHEEMLKVFLAREFQTTPEQITLPFVNREPVEITLNHIE
ncbi:MAG: DUF4875 domain-containing protein [Enterovibrio sp.]